MARVLLSALVSDIRGKLNGSVFKQSNAGLLIQNKVVGGTLRGKKVAKFKAGNALANRSAPLAASIVRNVWNGFTPQTRSIWDSMASAQKVAQRNNSSLFITGLQLFLKANIIRQLLGQNLVLVPNLGLPPGTPINVVSVIRTATLVVNLDRAWAVNETLILKMTAPIRDTVNTLGSRARLIRVQPVVLDTFVDVTQQYLDEFGSLPNIGETIFTSVTAQNDANGLALDVRVNRIEMA